MPGSERRVSARKPVSLAIEFHVVEPVTVGSANMASRRKAVPEKNPSPGGVQEGKSINLSERGIYFTTPARLQIGEPIEMYFTLPRELTGRSPERIRCSARVVHMDQQANGEGAIAVGAAVERFEPLQSIRDWEN